jgi:ABC-type transport system involved in cytochrome c biogenesis permease subunit
MYLFQERQLKSRQFGKMAFRLPALEQLDDISIKSILVGFPLHTLALVSGFLWAERARGSFFQLRPLEVWSVVSWLIYAGILYARVSAGWRGRKFAILAILGFCLVLLTFIGVKVIGGGAGR